MPKKKLKNPFVNYQLPDEYGRFLGYKVTKFDTKKNCAEMTLVLKAQHASPAGRIHGGVISGLFDACCGVAVFTTMRPTDFCSTVELKVNYFAPLVVGQVLIAKSKVAFRGNRLCSVEAHLFCKGKKEPAGMATATFYVVRGK